jgi:phenylacetic acid degradation protein paaN
MATLFETHRAMLEGALAASRARGFWSAFPESPSGRFYGETAKDDGLAAYRARLNATFALPGHPAQGEAGGEVSPYGGALGVLYPAAGADSLISAAQTAMPAWAAASAEARVGVCLEILKRLNARSFEIANAVMQTTGQGFPMAFQAGGPHAQDRGLEAVAYAWEAMSRTPAAAEWTKQEGRGEPIVLEKRWRIVPRGIGLVIGCNTFPTWNSYAGLFASLATGNPVIVKPHPQAILPLAITVEVCRAVLAEQGFDANVVTLAAENPGGEMAKALVGRPEIALIDYTGGPAFGGWVRANAGAAQVFSEEAGVNSVVVAGTDDFKGMCGNLAFSLALYSGQMCTAPQAIYVPRDGIDTNEGRKSFDEVAQGIAAATDRLLGDPARAAAVCGALAAEATLERVREAAKLGRVVRASGPIAGMDGARTATPLILAVDAAETDAYLEERFGPIAFVVAVDDAADGLRRAAASARDRGAITAAVYATDPAFLDAAEEAFAAAGANLSCNLTGGVYVNQSAAFSDFHATGANPAANACFTDLAFVANRFRVAAARRPKAA